MTSDTCRRCGRRLTVPRSMEREYGPTCFRYLMRERYDAYWGRVSREEAEGKREKYVLLEPG